MVSSTSGYWARKSELSDKANKHTNLMESKYTYEISNSFGNSLIFSDGFSFCSGNPSRDVVLESLDTVSALFKYFKRDKKIALLNFASYRNPGGKFLCGSSAQEESLCHSSYLYNVLSKFDSYYSWNNKHKNNSLYKNRAIYSPSIRFFLDGYTCTSDVITCAAPNYSSARRFAGVSSKQNLFYLSNRCNFVLDIAEDQGVDTLILGAFGCGVFGQSGTDVARCFKKHLESHCFSKVVFAIPNKGMGYENYSMFQKVFVSK